MKTLLYSIHGFDSPYLEREANNKHDFSYTEVSLNLETVKKARGYLAVSLFSNDDASGQVLEELAKLGVRYIHLDQ